MGRVVEVENLADGVHHALKYCDGSPLGKKRLIREARILAGFDHPHLLPVVGSNLSHDPPYFLMPLASSTLEAELGREVGDLSWACGAFRHVCLGVQALHQAGIVHRDLKPANILRLHDRYVVADLGTGKREPRDSTVLTGTCAILGTLSYLAPEQLMPGGSRHADARTDIYQLGKVLYQMITRRSPAVIDASALPPGLSHIVQRATAARPPDRYPDVAELLEAVEAYHASAPCKSRRAILDGLSNGCLARSSGCSKRGCTTVNSSTKSWPHWPISTGSSLPRCWAYSIPFPPACSPGWVGNGPFCSSLRSAPTPEVWSTRPRAGISSTRISWPGG